MIKTKLIASLEKPFADESFDNYPEHKRMSALAGETVSFQLLYTYDRDEENRPWVVYSYELSGELSSLATVREVKNIGVQKPIGVKSDDNYLRTAPGIYPDVLMKSETANRFVAAEFILNSLWIDVKLPVDCAALSGERTLTVTTKRAEGGEVMTCETFTLDVIPCELGEEKTLFTQWVYSEGLAHYYRVPNWSERHWEIIENFLRSARAGGMNVLFTPAFSALATITKTEKGYSFNFKKFDRWLAMANRLGFKYLEIPHLFSSGDAAYCADIWYREGGELKRTKGKLKANDPEYLALARATLRAIINHMKHVDDDKRLIFHIADEPALKNIDKFRAARESVIDIIGDYQIIDAIFDIEYWREGLVTAPVPITDHIDPFLKENVPNLWTYYCTGPQSRYSNRFIAQKGACTRSLGMQLYKYNITGFLHWALCYYGAGDAEGFVNPFLELSGENWVPAGDTMTLYPSPDGTPYESMRHIILRDVFQDVRAMQTAEKYYSHEAVVAAIEEELGCTLEFYTCAKSTETMLRIRERVNEMIKKAIKG